MSMVGVGGTLNGACLPLPDMSSCLGDPPELGVKMMRPSSSAATAVGAVVIAMKAAISARITTSSATRLPDDVGVSQRVRTCDVCTGSPLFCGQVLTLDTRRNPRQTSPFSVQWLALTTSQVSVACVSPDRREKCPGDTASFAFRGSLAVRFPTTGTATTEPTRPSTPHAKRP